MQPVTVTSCCEEKLRASAPWIPLSRGRRCFVLILHTWRFLPGQLFDKRAVKYFCADTPGSRFAATPVPSARYSSTPSAPPRSRFARTPGIHHQTSSSTPPRTAYRPVRARSRSPHLAGPTSSLSQPSWPSFSNVSIFLSKISAASGNASTARSMLCSRSKCKIGYGERLL